jgi:hypothetical protein
MLQHNNAQHGRRAHLAHAAVVGLHALCCGLPALVMLAAALSGAASSVVLLSDSVQQFHDFMHAYEAWILGLSAALVVGGGWIELNQRRSGGHHLGFPWLFALSVGCFVLNVAIIVAHRLV